jgi:very-short-patch-repair endonuclease
VSIGTKKSVFAAVTKQTNASKPHRRVLQLLREIYPGFTVDEEQRIECRINGQLKRLPVDLTLNDLKVAIEVQGSQHFKYIEHFHRNADGFQQQQARDISKSSAIREHGWHYLAIDEATIAKLTAAKLTRLISKAMKTE